MATQDDPRDVAFNSAAPEGERFDASAELSKAHRPTASSLIPSSDMRAIIDVINEGLDQGELMKARNNIVSFPEVRGNKPNKRGMQSVFVDNLQIFKAGDFFEKPSPVGFDALRTMCEQTPILASVLMTRVRQVNRFCNLSEDGGPGFEVRHIDRKHILTPDETEATKLLGQFVANCGWEPRARARKKLKRDTFPQFMAKSVRDTLAMDACPIETEMKQDRSLGIDGFYAIDGATVRLCTEEGYQGDDQIFALQVVDGRISTAYNYDQLIYEVRNPRTDVRLSGYGLAEPEMLVRVVTGFLNAMTYNIKGFDSNSVPKGLLHLSGDYSQEDLGAFKRYWNSMVKGINNAWALPVMVSKDQESKATFENFGVEFNEMYFAKWMSFLCSIITAIYGMDPAEINFESFAAQKSSLSGSDTGEKLANAKDKGLRPFMSFYEGMLTDFIIQEFSDKYCFRWVGLEEEDPKELLEKQKLILTVNELRAECGYEPYPIGDDGVDLGEAPLNVSLVGAWQQATMPPPDAPGNEFGGGAPEETGDFGSVPGDPGEADSPDAAKPGGVPSTSSSGDYGGKKPEMAKAWVYRIGDDS
jgi:hypothetical protein